VLWHWLLLACDSLACTESPTNLFAAGIHLELLISLGTKPISRDKTHFSPKKKKKKKGMTEVKLPAASEQRHEMRDLALKMHMMPKRRTCASYMEEVTCPRIPEIFISPFSLWS
jgi:hypothetical protein